MRQVQLAQACTVEQATVSDRAVKAMPRHVAALRQLCLDAGADDVGFVELDRTAIAAVPDLLPM